MKLMKTRIKIASRLYARNLLVSSVLSKILVGVELALRDLIQ